MRVKAADVAAFYRATDEVTGGDAGTTGKQAPGAPRLGVGRRKAPIPCQTTGGPDAARLGASTGLVGLALCVAAATWLLTTVAATEMPMVTRLLVIAALFAGGAGLAWLGGRIERLGGGRP